MARNDNHVIDIAIPNHRFKSNIDASATVSRGMTRDKGVLEVY